MTGFGTELTSTLAIRSTAEAGAILTLAVRSSTRRRTAVRIGTLIAITIDTATIRSGTPADIRVIS